eukprot:CAMPEP_0115021828 /NCGR_PEP_ID=MMETSP0216-20121206/31140_1 /TAXON_ID=223996 /ORGANISM="Protocruzia adherens, Strain Boccale" /LENGTH=264 /DNA_ID=CAMNT_0002394301 /DNA_START=71 /DNA_END=865 /DNA_ORIENTATION=-
MQSVLTRVDQTLAALLLGFIVIYWYSSWTFFSSTIGKSDYNFEGQMLCDQSLSKCFVAHMMYGFGNAPIWQLDQSDFNVQGTVHNISYVFFVNLILTAIISGIIIDNFSALRARQEEVEDDVTSKCFICSLPRSTFEMKGMKFKDHYRFDHYLWEYVWFYIYLRDLKENNKLLSMNSLESFVWNCSLVNAASFFPLNKSMALKTTDMSYEEEINNNTILDKISTAESNWKDELDDMKNEIKILFDQSNNKAGTTTLMAQRQSQP